MKLRKSRRVLPEYRQNRSFFRRPQSYRFFLGPKIPVPFPSAKLRFFLRLQNSSFFPVRKVVVPFSVRKSEVFFTTKKSPVFPTENPQSLFCTQNRKFFFRQKIHDFFPVYKTTVSFPTAKLLFPHGVRTKNSPLRQCVGCMPSARSPVPKPSS